MRVKADSDILCEDFILGELPVGVPLVDGGGFAPFGASVFLAGAQIALGLKINPDCHSVGGDKKEDSFYAVTAPLDFERIV